MTMTLEDFEKSLAEGKNQQEKENSSQEFSGSRKHHHHHHHHRRKHYDSGEDPRRHKRRKRSTSRDDQNRAPNSVKAPLGYRRERTESETSQGEGETTDPATWNPGQNDGHLPTSTSTDEIKRDAWMEQPSGLDIDYTQKGVVKPAEHITSRPSKVDFELKIHENELNKHHLQDLADGKTIPDGVDESLAQHEVDYVFGDAGSQWRMSKLNRVHRRAAETGTSADEMGEEYFGSLQAFDDAREEQIELERRDTYGEGYVGKKKPSGELFAERKLDMGPRTKHSGSEHGDNNVHESSRELESKKPAAMIVPMDPTSLNRLKAQMLKARTRGSSNTAALEAEYNTALANFANSKQSNVIVLGGMDDRMLAGSREGEIKKVGNKRGRERGLVEENENMSIEDMMRQERRSRNEAGGDGQRFAERIAKDVKFDVTDFFPTKRWSLTHYSE